MIQTNKTVNVRVRCKGMDGKVIKGYTVDSFTFDEKEIKNFSYKKTIDKYYSRFKEVIVSYREDGITD